MTNLLPPPASQPPTISSPSSTAYEQPTPASPHGIDSRQEIEWKNSLRNLEHQMAAYKGSRTEDGKAPLQAVEGVAVAMEQVADSHTDPAVKKHWRERAKIFRTAKEDERDGILKEIGKGFLILLTTPFFLVGAVLQATGGLLNGVGSILKGLGRLTRKLSYTGESRNNPSSESSGRRE